MTALTETRDHARRMAARGGADRALWLQIADEIDEYLAGPVEHVDLFGDTTPEPHGAEVPPPVRPAPLPDPVVPTNG